MESHQDPSQKNWDPSSGSLWDPSGISVIPDCHWIGNPMILSHDGITPFPAQLMNFRPEPHSIEHFLASKHTHRKCILYSCAHICMYHGWDTIMYYRWLLALRYVPFTFFAVIGACHARRDVEFCGTLVFLLWGMHKIILLWIMPKLKQKLCLYTCMFVTFLEWILYI